MKATKKSMTFLILLTLISIFSCNQNKNNKKENNTKTTLRQQTPLMGWSSWNNYFININDSIICAQADAMVSSGMKDVGYSYINIDDGYFGGRDKNGNLLAHKKRFPKGMKQMADYIHSKGLKAGIYSDAGLTTCASGWNKDTIGAGCGLFNHEYEDLNLMLNKWGYDFIKIDWCGGRSLGLNDQTQYTLLSKIIRQVNPNVIYNVCRWRFPGKWVIQVADSWRISGDISNNFKSVMYIVDLNADLWKYSGPGHVNDMDMLQVGRGMTYEEDKTHFSMWCMMCSPLLAGNDLATMSKETTKILTNKDLIDINQNSLVYQARRIKDYGDLEVWARPLNSTMSGKVAVALLNRSKQTADIELNIEDIGLNSQKGYTMKELWSKKEYKTSKEKIRTFKVPSHGVLVFKVEGTMKPFNIFQFK